MQMIENNWIVGVGLSAIEEEPSLGGINSPEVPAKREQDSPKRSTLHNKPARKNNDEINFPLQTKARRLSNKEQQNPRSSSKSIDRQLTVDNNGTARVTQSSLGSAKHTQPLSSQQRQSTLVSTNSTQNDERRSSLGAARKSRQHVKFQSSIPQNLLSIDYRDNDPNFYQDDNPQNQNPLRKNRSGENFDFLGVVRDSQDLFTLQPSSILENSQPTFIDGPSMQQMAYSDPNTQIKTEVRDILERYQAKFKNKQQTFVFSKLRILTVTEEGEIQNMRLKQDPFRQAVREFQSKQRRSQQRGSRKDKVAQSLQVQPGEGTDLATKLHQIQPSVLLSKDAGNSKFSQLQIQSSSVDFDDQNFDSPRLTYRDEEHVQTHRIYQAEDDEDQLLLETPVHRNSNLDTFRGPLTKADYSKDQIQDMQMSIRNISTNKKVSRRQLPGKVLIQQPKQKELESFRQIREEPSGLSDDEGEKSWGGASFNTEQRLIKNPTYTRITHASKGMPTGLTRGTGGLMRNDYMNPMMKSMPNLDFLKQKDTQAESDSLEHSKTLFDLNSTLLRANNTKVREYSSPNSRNTGKSGNGKHRLFEEFFIIGAEAQDLAQLEWAKGVETQYLQPKTLYMYNQHSVQDCERRRVVKDFCFPDGIEIKLLKKPNDPLQQISAKAQKILYSSKSVREQCFVFILNANDEALSENSQDRSYLETFPGGQGMDKYYNCLCVIFQELVSNDGPYTSLKGKDRDRKFQQASVYATKKAYCFMFTNSYYQLQLDVLNMLINALKIERLRISTQMLQMEPQLSDQTYTDILSMLDLPLICTDHTRILNKYSLLSYTDSSTNLQLDLGPSFGHLRYDLVSPLDATFLDQLWFGPSLFSLFPLPTLLRLMHSALLERSLIFVSKSSALLSSCILGLQALLYPFKWCLALVPILPHPLIEMLEAPLPLLIGITKREYREITLTREERESKIWVFVETSEVQWTQEAIPEFKMPEMEKIQAEYDNFRRSYLYTQQDSTGLDSDRSSSLSSDLDSSQMYTDELRQSCKAVCSLLRKGLKQKLLDPIKLLPPPTINMKNGLQELCDYMVNQAHSYEEKEFMQEFVQTQMFTTYVEENLKLFISYQF